MDSRRQSRNTLHDHTPDQRREALPPLLRWAGSKRKLLPVLMRCAPRDYLRYIEPFAGSACCFFSLRPRRAVLGDMNSELLETYGTIRAHPSRVAEALHSYGSPRRYYTIRKLTATSLDAIPRAARFVYLNRNCFNGVYRTNRKGHFNVPRGVKTGNPPSARDFRRCAIALRDAELRPGDFESCLSDVARGDFVYLDPPYANERRPLYGEYGYGSFSPKDLDRLVQCLKHVESVGAMFLLSYSDSPLLTSMLPKRWHCCKIQVRRHVAGFAKHRGKVPELLVANYPIAGGELT
jgi:DNA adenine methylase